VDVCGNQPGVQFNGAASNACAKYNQAASDRTAGAILGGVGGIALIAGAVLLLTDSTRESTGAPPPSARVERPHVQVLPYARRAAPAAGSTWPSRSDGAEHVGHPRSDRGLARDPAREAEGAGGKELAAGGAVNELDPLAGAEEGDGVLADDVAAAHGVDADLRSTARPGPPLAPVHEPRAAPCLARDLRDAEAVPLGRRP